MRIIRLITLAAPLMLSAPAAAAEPGFKALFNGKDLSGWRLGKDSLAGKAESADGRFKVRAGVILITGASGPSEPKMKEIDTLESFGGDFTLRFEFKASQDANSGLHLRDHVFAHQLQIRDYPRAGPYKALKHYKSADWNAVEVIVKASPDGKGAVAHCTCNGEVLEAALALPADGPIGLQSETNTVEYRNLRIKMRP